MDRFIAARLVVSCENSPRRDIYSCWNNRKSFFKRLNIADQMSDRQAVQTSFAIGLHDNSWCYWLIFVYILCHSKNTIEWLTTTVPDVAALVTPCSFFVPSLHAHTRCLRVFLCRTLWMRVHCQWSELRALASVQIVYFLLQTSKAGISQACSIILWGVSTTQSFRYPHWHFGSISV